MPKAETHFASPERLEKGEIKEQYEKVLSLEHTKEISLELIEIMMILLIIWN